MNDAISPAKPTRLTKGKIVGIGRSQLNSFQSCSASAARFLDLMHQLEDFTHSVSPEQAHTQFDETTLQLFWMRWPQLSEWAGSLWRLLSEELAGPSAPHDDSELFEIGESG